MTTYLSTRQVCHTLNISRWQVTRLIKSGRLAAIKGAGVNGHYRIDADSLAAYVEECKVEASA
jgi:excisionase family DNA binding protein